MTGIGRSRTLQCPQATGRKGATLTLPLVKDSLTRSVLEFAEKVTRDVPVGHQRGRGQALQTVAKGLSACTEAHAASEERDPLRLIQLLR